MRFEEHPKFTAARQRMIAEQLRSRGIRDERVLAAMQAVPRHVFIDERYWNEAYEDHPVAIGEGQTISQPYMVATMLEALRVSDDMRVLEIGTGTGYQAALLSQLARVVVTVERIGALANRARANFAWLAIENAEVIVADGTLGYAPRAPYDRVIVAAAAPCVPRAMTEQLAEGGMLLIPVGAGDTQFVERIRRAGQDFHKDTLDACRFVPLIGEQGFRG